MVPLFNVPCGRELEFFSREQEKNETKNIMKLMERVSKSGAWRKIESGKKKGLCFFVGFGSIVVVYKKNR